MQYNPKSNYTCPVCNQSKPRDKANWLEAEPNNTFHEQACRACVLEREKQLRASPVSPRIVDIIRRMDNRVKRWNQTAGTIS